MEEFSADNIKAKLRMLKEDSGVEYSTEGLQRRFLQFQASFRFSQDGQLLLTKTGEILAANPAICQLLGYSLSEILEKRRNELMLEADTAVQKLVKTPKKTGNAVAVIDMIHRSGERIPVEASNIHFEIENELYAAVTIRDLRPQLALEAEKRVADNFVQLLMDNTEESFFLLDRDLKIVLANKTARLMSERLLKKKIVTGMSIFDLAQEERLTELKNIYAEVLCGIKRDSEIIITQPDGGKRWFLITYTPLFDENAQIQGVFVSTSEITATKNAEIALQKQKALFESLVQRTSDGTIILDTDGKIIFVNESSRVILGFAPESVLGKSGFDLVYPEDLNIARQALSDILLKADASLEIEIRLVDMKGKPIWCELRAVNQIINPHIAGIVIHFYDIQIRKSQEEEIRESRKNLSQLLNNTEESFILCDRKLRITAFNQAASKRNMLINNRPMEIGADLLVSISPQRITQVKALAKQIFKEGLPIRTQAQHILGSGDIVYLALEYSPVIEEDGSISGICIVANDITEMRKAEQALLRSKQRLMQAQQIAKLGHWDYEAEADILHWSEEVYSLYGWNKKEIAPNMADFYALVHEEDRVLVNEAVQNVLTGKSQKLDIQHRLLKHKNVRWLHQRGEIRRGDDGSNWLNVSVQDITEQKAIDHEIELSIERFRMVEMATNDVIWEMDFITGQLIWAQSLTRVFGYNLRNLQAYTVKWWEEKVHPADVKRVTHSLFKHQHSGEKIWTEQYRFQHADGSYRDVLDRGYTVFNKNGEPLRLIGSMQDITETIDNQRQLTEYADRLEGMVNSITDAFFTIDKNWRLSYLNPVAESIFAKGGLTSRNKVIWEEFPELVATDFERNLRKSVTAKNSYQFTYLLFDRWFAFNLYPQQRGLSVYARDVTAKKQEEERLRLLESAITNSNDAFLITEAEPIGAPGPRIVFVNEAFTRMTGYTAAEVIGKTPRILQGPETDKNVLAKIRSALEKWEAIEVEIINYKKDGEPFWSNFSIVPIADEKGWYTHWISVQRNVSARKATEVAQKQLNEELMKQNYGLEQFSYITSHNLRAPVANILSILDLLNHEHWSDPANEELIDMIAVSAHRMDETLNELIKVLKIKGETNPPVGLVNFNKVYERVIDNIGALLNEAEGEVITHFEPLEMFYTTSHIENIMLNMLTNAIKYRSRQRRLKIELSSSIVDDYVVLSFRDNGLGIDLQRYKSRLFGMYQRFHNNADSRGLGLYIVHAQVQALGGRIEVESEIEVGTTFRVYLKNSFDARINH